MSGHTDQTAPKAPMISATGNKRPRSVAGFSLIEIALVLGLITVAASIVIANFATMADRGDAQSTQELIHASVRKARFVAASSRTVTTLQFNKELGSLQISDSESITLNSDFSKDGPAQIRFFLVPPAQGLERFPEAERTQLQTNEVRFAPDRSSSPFVVEIDSGSGTPERMVFDPFSSLLRSSE
jgi:Tfp pilus assembly protein FimT